MPVKGGTVWTLQYIWGVITSVDNILRADREEMKKTLWHQDMLLLPLNCRLLKRLKWHLSCRPSDSGLNFAVAWILVLDKSPMIIKRQLCSLQHFSFTVSVTHALSWKKESFINVFPVPAPSSSPRCRSGLPGGAQARPAGGDAVLKIKKAPAWPRCPRSGGSSPESGGDPAARQLPAGCAGSSARQRRATAGTGLPSPLWGRSAAGCGCGPAGQGRGRAAEGAGLPAAVTSHIARREEGKEPHSGGGIQPHVYSGRRRLTAPALCEPRREEAAAAAARGRAVRAAAAGPAAAAPW